MSIHKAPSPEHLRILLARAERDAMDDTVIERLKVILHFAEHQYSISDTCVQFGISRSTFHRWIDRFDPEDLSTLADKSHEPLMSRQSAIDPATVELIRRYRMRYPLMGKERIAELLLRDHAMDLSASSIGRIIERECLYFADTPLHWKKRIEHTKSAEASIDALEMPVSAKEVVADLAAESTTHVAITPEMMDEPSSQLPYFSWQGIRRFIVVSSVITNIVFVSLLIGMALVERVSEAQAASSKQGIENEQHEVLHAAPAQVYIP